MTDAHIDYKQLARELALIVDVGTSDDPGTALVKLRKIQSDAAALMRNKCVERVKAMRDEWTVNAINERRAASEIITALSSLTLDQVKPGEM